MEHFLSATPLFNGISQEEIHTMLSCLGAERRSYAKGEAIYRTGMRIQSMGLVLSGRVQVENNDLWGNTSILVLVEPGAVFAET